MDKSDFNILFNKLKNYSNDDLNKLTLNLIENNENSLNNSFSKKYNSTELINGVNKINFKLFGGEDIVNEGIDEVADLKIELDAARKRINSLLDDNKALRESGNDKESIMSLIQKQDEEKADLENSKSELAKSMTKNKLKIKKLNDLKKRTELASKKVESDIEKLKLAKKESKEALEKLKSAKAKLKKQEASVKEADNKVKAKLKELEKNKKTFQRNMIKLKKLEKNNEIKLKNLQKLETIARNQQKKADAIEKQALATSKRVDDARTKLKLQSEDFDRSREIAIDTIKTGIKNYKEYAKKRNKEEDIATSDIENTLINSLKSISKIRS